jgi:hypothetical protein
VHTADGGERRDRIQHGTPRNWRSDHGVTSRIAEHNRYGACHGTSGRNYLRDRRHALDGYDRHRYTNTNDRRDIVSRRPGNRSIGYWNICNWINGFGNRRHFWWCDGVRYYDSKPNCESRNRHQRRCHSVPCWVRARSSDNTSHDRSWFGHAR